MWGYTSYQPYAVPCYTPRATYAEAQHWYQTEPLYQQCVEPPRRQGTTQHQRLPARHRTDPADYGWHFQGSNEASRVDYLARVEENGTDVKMDYYPTTGTVKTVMNHPRQGKTQMFRRNLSEKQFQRVLSDPRSHTGKGYQFKHTGGYSR